LYLEERLIEKNAEQACLRKDKDRHLDKDSSGPSLVSVYRKLEPSGFLGAGVSQGHEEVVGRVGGNYFFIATTLGTQKPAQRRHVESNSFSQFLLGASCMAILMDHLQFASSGAGPGSQSVVAFGTAGDDSLLPHD
jgi:hypothetical protein